MFYLLILSHGGLGFNTWIWCGGHKHSDHRWWQKGGLEKQKCKRDYTKTSEAGKTPELESISLPLLLLVGDGVSVGSVSTKGVLPGPGQNQEKDAISAHSARVCYQHTPAVSTATNSNWQWLPYCWIQKEKTLLFLM